MKTQNNKKTALLSTALDLIMFLFYVFIFVAIPQMYMKIMVVNEMPLLPIIGYMVGGIIIGIKVLKINWMKVLK